VTEHDETSPVDTDALARIRDEAVKSQAASSPVSSTGARRRPRKRAGSESGPTTSVSRPERIGMSPPSMGAEAVPEFDYPEEELKLWALSESAVAPTAVGLAPAGSESVGADLPLDRNSAPDSSGYWQPGSRLGVRVNDKPPPLAVRKSSGRGALLAFVIVALAIVIAVGLYLLANALVDGDEGPVEGNDGTEQSE